MTRRSTTVFCSLLIVAGAYACADRGASPPTAPLTSRPTAARAADSDEESGEGRSYLPGERGWSARDGAESSTMPRLVSCERRAADAGSADIGPSGGELVVGRARLIVPPGALTRTVRISATTPSAENAFVSFQPEGLVFRKPAGLVFDAGECSLSSEQVPDVGYLGDDGQLLERIPARYSNYWHTVAAPIGHFSGYALVW